MQDYTLKKALGQHFLKDEKVLEQIMDALGKTTFSRLLEVGPGGGALTRHLLQLRGIELKAVELDEEKVVYLHKTYPELEGKIIHKSILELEPPFEKDFTIIGNFPYNISSQILFKVLDWKDQVPSVFGMFQKEVAERIASKGGSKDYGILSVLIQAYYDVTYLFDVPATCFNPPPKVMSGVIELTRRTTPEEVASHKKFRLLVKTAFNQRRKMLRNAVKGLFDPDFLKDDIFNKRAEQLSVADFARLSFKMK
ncbi:16S rRNA (adenine(1518)-N(6)/adenine(1519)-N(6))-dimethyltransferase RsmA [Arachidicoccus terrestris]|uniref:16S rRNA (adenine(1518)-N(6)/adenine(1519)-N(6))- dimethyltransferase RsmA n=1 Tax=Arachidicoccus terrestris TaxID=2875539 RepID=UPI001CC66DE6|nr:16S rRNA (adenine(1518)-N(6)/adenine(1519)-N(6))-dimethyltransferase RsmA [Arachidicoccus terrestris]UAY57119.1 16S rRNA (adenine(1518)-N(6)/adenine(1519)-N(6))-dimethyltransferase RsmA [Arachidicoccus terrestris]